MLAPQMRVLRLLLNADIGFEPINVPEGHQPSFDLGDLFYRSMGRELQAKDGEKELEKVDLKWKVEQRGKSRSHKRPVNVWRGSSKRLLEWQTRNTDMATWPNCEANLIKLLSDAAQPLQSPFPMLRSFVEISGSTRDQGRARS